MPIGRCVLGEHLMFRLIVPFRIREVVMIAYMGLYVRIACCIYSIYATPASKELTARSRVSDKSVCDYLWDLWSHTMTKSSQLNCSTGTL